VYGRRRSGVKELRAPIWRVVFLSTTFYRLLSLCVDGARRFSPKSQRALAASFRRGRLPFAGVLLSPPPSTVRSKRGWIVVIRGKELSAEIRWIDGIDVNVEIGDR
jgi:hypothetical protein